MSKLLEMSSEANATRQPRVSAGPAPPARGYFTAAVRRERNETPRRQHLHDAPPGRWGAGAHAEANQEYGVFDFFAARGLFKSAVQANLQGYHDHRAAPLEIRRDCHHKRTATGWMARATRAACALSAEWTEASGREALDLAPAFIRWPPSRFCQDDAKRRSSSTR